MDFDQRICFNTARDFFREHDAIDAERMSTGHARLLWGTKKQAARPPQFFFKKPWSTILLLGFERITAHQLCKPIGLVRLSAFERAHLVDDAAEPCLRDLRGGFTPGESSTNDVKRIHNPGYGVRGGSVQDVAPELPVALNVRITC